MRLLLAVLIALGTLVWPALLPAMEIATGYMLGPRYDPRSFYYRTPGNSTWRQTYSERGYRREARGKLMNVRLTQALFQDEWLTERPFDSSANTNRAIEALDVYKRHGVLGVTVSLQGDDPGYAASGISRQNGFRYGPQGGTLVSAYRPDGSLKAEWMERLERLLRAADQREMVVCLIYFYPGQDEALDLPETLEVAARNVTDWLIDKKFRNVIVDVASGWDEQGDRWGFGQHIPQNIGSMVDKIRERFENKHADFVLPIGASTGGRMMYPASLAGESDVVLLHGDGRPAAEKLDRLRQYKEYARPLLMIEDDNGRGLDAASLAAERASCDALFHQGSGWGYTPWAQTMRFPFDYAAGPTGEFTDQAPPAERGQRYFHAVLDHMARLVLNRAPEGEKWKK